MKIINLTLTIIISTLYIANNIYASEISQQIIGIWENQPRAELLHFYEDKNTQKLTLARFQFTPISTLLEQPPFEITTETLAEIHPQENSLQINQQLYQKTTRLTNIFPQSPGTPLENFDILAETFNQHYAFFDRRNINWQKLIATYRNKISTQTTSEELFQILKELLSQLKDNHVALAQSLDKDGESYFGFILEPTFNNQLENERLSFIKNQKEDIDISDYIDLTVNMAVKSIEDNYLFEQHKHPSNKLIWGRTKANPEVGYLNILSMQDLPSEELQASLDHIIQYFNKNTIKSLIIDIRFNQGGDDAMSLAIAERFTHSKQLAFTTQTYYNAGSITEKTPTYLNPENKELIWKDNIQIYLLTSPITASAAEAFVLAISALPNVTRIGDSTMGILSDQFARKLPNGWWFMLSNEIRLDHQGQLFEATGIPPHIKTNFPFISISNLKQDPAINTILLPPLPPSNITPVEQYARGNPQEGLWPTASECLNHFNSMPGPAGPMPGPAGPYPNNPPNPH